MPDHIKQIYAYADKAWWSFNPKSWEEALEAGASDSEKHWSDIGKRIRHRPVPVRGRIADENGDADLYTLTSRILVVTPLDWTQDEWTSRLSEWRG